MKVNMLYNTTEKCKPKLKLAENRYKHKSD